MTGGNQLFASRKGPNKKSMFRKGPNEVSKAWKKTKITKKKMYAALLFFRFKHGYLSFDFSELSEIGFFRSSIFRYFRYIISVSVIPLQIYRCVETEKQIHCDNLVRHCLICVQCTEAVFALEMTVTASR